MLVLALDTALAACSVALVDSDGGDARVLAQESAAMTRGHAEALMPMVARVMAAGAVGFGALDRIATTVGPGSFTGLRVSIAAARGIALAAAKPVVGITTLAALTAPAHADHPDAAIVAAIDARHGHVYHATSIRDATGAALTSRPRVDAVADLVAVVARLAAAPVLVGDAAALLAAAWPATAEAPRAVAATPAPDVVWVARLAVQADPETAPARPLYLRAPDAKPAAAPLTVAAP